MAAARRYATASSSCCWRRRDPARSRSTESSTGIRLNRATPGLPPGAAPFLGRLIMKLSFALTGFVFLGLASMAHANDAAVDATIKQFADAFNKGDLKTAKALHVASPIIIDEVPPHLWTGMKAFDQWGADLGK